MLKERPSESNAPGQSGLAAGRLHFFRQLPLLNGFFPFTGT